MDPSNDLSISEFADSDTTQITSYHNETHCKVKEFICTWVIKDLAICYMQPNHFIKSSEFTCNHYSTISWSMLLYPGGYVDKCKDFISLEIFGNCNQIVSKSVYIKISIVDSEGDEEVVYQNFHSFTTKDTSLIINEFLPRKSLENHLCNGNLTIRCRMYIYENYEFYEVTSKKQIDDKETLHYRLMELNDFEHLIDNEKLSDIELILDDGQKIKANKCILITRSPVFAKIIENISQENKELKVENIEYKVMKELLRFIYSGRVNDLEEMPDKLLIVADRYELNGLKSMCEDILISDININTISTILYLADRANSKRIIAAIKDILSIHSKELASNVEFNRVVEKISLPLREIILKKLSKHV